MLRTSSVDTLARTLSRGSLHHLQRSLFLIICFSSFSVMGVIVLPKTYKAYSIDLLYFFKIHFHKYVIRNFHQCLLHPLLPLPFVWAFFFFFLIDLYYSTDSRTHSCQRFFSVTLSMGLLLLSNVGVSRRRCRKRGINLVIILTFSKAEWRKAGRDLVDIIGSVLAIRLWKATSEKIFPPTLPVRCI